MKLAEQFLESAAEALFRAHTNKSSVAWGVALAHYGDAVQLVKEELYDAGYRDWLNFDDFEKEFCAAIDISRMQHAERGGDQ